jgi:hypothetical protein
MSSRLDPAFVRREIANLRVTHPGIWDEGDEQLLADMLEAETGLNELLSRAVAVMLDTDAKIDGIGDLMTTLKARCNRFEQRSDAMRALMFKLLQEAGVRKVELPIATLSIRTGQQKVIITDEAALSDKYVRIKREPDKTAIKEAITGGVMVMGAELSNREESLTVRVK